MEIYLNIFIFLLGLFLLILSSDWFIQGCVKISYLFKLTPLFIGLILVAFGTSTPEAGVGIIAVIKNQKNIALGNIVGSNISNIGLILGLCALFSPLGVDKNIVKRELPIMVLSAILFYILSLDLLISRFDGAIFMVCFIIFFFISYKGAKRYPSSSKDETDNFTFRKPFKKDNPKIIVLVFTLVFLLGIILGADLMVRGGVSLAKIFGVSSWVISITVFAVGTSLPELVASLTAIKKKVPSISVGNVVGSNIFNIFFVLGIIAMMRPIGLQPAILRFEFPVLLVFSLILFVVMKTNYRIARWEGFTMFLGYIGFLFFLLRE